MSVLVYVFAVIGAIAVLGLLLTAAWVAWNEEKYRRRGDRKATHRRRGRSG